MPLSRLLLPCLVLIAVVRAFSTEPVPKALREPFPAAPASPVKTRAAEEAQPLPREESALRPTGRPSLLPDEIPSAKKPPAAFAPSRGPKENSAAGLASTASEIDLRIRYRKARNVAEANGQVRAAWDESRLARTDFAKRRALVRYQDLLYARMLSIDRAIAPLIEQRRKAENSLLEQTHIAPTVRSE